MNIHFKNKELLQTLQKACLVKIEVGSALYGVKNEGSDTDMLCIYVPTCNKLHSFLNLHHTLQYKDEANNTDYIFEDLYTFIQNILSGDSSIYFEALHTDTLQNSVLSYLYENRTDFYSYNVVKAYAGFCKRDRKYLTPSISAREQAKRLLHIDRGALFAEGVLDKNLVINHPKIKERWEYFQTLSFQEKTKEAELLLEKAENIRKRVTEMLEQKKICRAMETQKQKNLDEFLYTLSKTEAYISRQTEYMNLELFYEALENGVNY